MQNVKKRIGASLGMGQPSAFDLVDRNAYDSDTAYIAALAAKQKELDSPEYQDAMRKVARERAYREEQEAIARDRKHHAELRASAELSSYDMKQINKASAEAAQREYHSGKIEVDAVRNRQSEISKQMEEKRKDEIATAAQFNEFIRGMVSGITDPDNN